MREREIKRERESKPSATLQLQHVTFAFRENSINHKSHNQGTSQVKIERKAIAKYFVFFSLQSILW